MKIAWKGIKFKKIKWNWTLFAAWGIPAGIMLVLFVVSSIYPFGDRSFLFSDMYHQYMPFFTEFMEKIKAGEGLSYSWNVGMGSNFLALYVYYLASPLHWLAFLVPQAYLMEFMSYLVVVKIGLCGLTFSIYLRKHFQTESITTVLFAVFYALSGYTAAYNWNIMWLDCLILFPLIIWGLERLVKEGKPVFYCLMLALSIFTNYYISIMICIFLVLYFITLLVNNERFIRPIWQFTVYSLLAGALAAILLIPEVCAIMATDFGAMEFPKEIRSYFSVLDELARHQMCVTTERQLEHWPNIYCGVAVLLLVPLFAICEKISAKRRFAMLGLSLVLLFSFSTNILDFIWHGLNYPDSLPARQSFIYIFLVLVMSYEAFIHFREMDKQKLVYCFLGATVFLLFCEKFAEDKDITMGLEVLTLAFMAVYGIVLFYFYHHREKEWQLVLCLVAFILVVTEAGINTYNTSIGTVSREDYLNPIKDYEVLYDYAKENTDGFFRMEKFDRRTKNDGTLAGYPTASLFSSTLNSSVADFYEKVGMRHSKVYYAFDGATPLISAMLNVNYMYGDKEKSEQWERSDNYDKLYTAVAESGDVTLYQCNYTLPFGFVVPMDFGMSDGKTGNPFLVQNDMVKRLGIKDNLFVRANTIKESDDLILVADKDAYYFALNGRGNSKVDMVGSYGTKSYKDLKYNSIMYVGYMEQAERMRIQNASEEEDASAVNVSAYRMQIGVLKEVLYRLSQQHMENVVYDSTHISGQITMAEAGKVFLSVPYEKGWTVYVNGEKTDTEIYGDCFMMVPLQPGEYEIALEYKPVGRAEGIVISICGVVLLLLLILMKRTKEGILPEEELSQE
ncbi:MAG: YfhO family protein [Lachnospiraceae bacterium]|nr:YfhO family protein [Lachnospiraceae bacterium]